MNRYSTALRLFYRIEIFGKLKIEFSRKLKFHIILTIINGLATVLLVGYGSLLPDIYQEDKYYVYGLFVEMAVHLIIYKKFMEEEYADADGEEDQPINQIEQMRPIPNVFYY
ncbi:hypothetical protein L3Y34_002358 [Caenorhabditis briggsae]|nr:hypothetical protein L3Y34_002358 [Caenorhabditis briggsae]